MPSGWGLSTHALVEGFLLPSQAKRAEVPDDSDRMCIMRVRGGEHALRQRHGGPPAAVTFSFRCFPNSTFHLLQTIRVAWRLAQCVLQAGRVVKQRITVLACWSKVNSTDLTLLASEQKTLASPATVSSSHVTVCQTSETVPSGCLEKTGRAVLLRLESAVSFCHPSSQFGSRLFAVSPFSWILDCTPSRAWSFPFPLPYSVKYLYVDGAIFTMNRI